MDRTGACGASNVGSIPTEGTYFKSTIQGAFKICALKQANCFACV